jgi:tetratricopeptide (TPR) repeat protein
MAAPEEHVGKRPEPIPGRGPRPRRRSPAFRVFRVVLILGVIALALTPVSRPAYRELKAWRARGQARQIEKRVEANEIKEAQVLVRSAVRLAPEDREVLRATARFCSRAGSPEAVAYWQKYLAVAGSSATAAEQREYVEAALTHGRLDLSRPLLSSLVRKTPSDPELLLLLARQHLIMRDIPRATATAKAMLALNPTDRRSQFLLGSVLLASTNTTTRSEGRRLVWSLVVDSGSYSTEGAELLADDTSLSRMEADQVIRRLATATNSALALKLKLASLRLRTETNRAEEIIGSTTATVEPGKDWVETAMMAEWLLRHDAARIPEWLPASLIATNRPLIALRAEALANLQRWSELLTFVEGTRGAIEPGLAHFFKGRAAAAAGKRSEAESEYRSAIDAAGDGRRWLAMLARAAEAQGMPLVAIHAWEKLLDDPRQTVEAARELTRLARPLDDLATLRRAIRRLSEFFNTDDSFSAERAVLDLLFNEEVASATKTLERLQSAPGFQPEWRAGLALARLRGNDPAAALAVLEDASFDFAAAPARTQAIYVAALGASKQREAARRFALKIKSDSLRQQERVLVQPWL